MKLVLMSTPNFFVEEHHILTALFDEGLELVHLNKPNSEPVFYERLLSLIPQKYRKNIITHDHFYLQNEYDLRGIHLSDSNLQRPDGYRGSVSCSCDDIDSVSSVKKQMDYVICNITNEDLAILAKDSAKRKLIDKKVYASGNLSIDDLSLLGDLGFGGVVVDDIIWECFDIHNTQDFKEIINQFRKIQRIVD